MIRLRVRVEEAWEDVDLAAASDTTVADIKRRALDAVRSQSDPRGFLVKFRGAAIQDENASVASMQIPDNAPLIVMRARRVPVH